MARLELFGTQYCWECSACHQKFDVMWRPTDKPFKPPFAYMWAQDKPSFKYCPVCGDQFENTEDEKM